MQKNELTFDVIEALKEIAANFQPTLLQKVRAELNNRDLRLLDYVFEHYYTVGKVRGRWYDPYHILFSASFAIQLVKINKKISPLIVPAIILHDIGFQALPDEAKENWNASQNRIMHMQEGAALSAEILVRLGSYKAEEIGVIIGMVATHDNGYIGIETEDPPRLALRDADRVFVTHFISFYKDWISEDKNRESSLIDLYKLRRDRAYRKDKPFFHTGLARQWRDRQFKGREQEIKNNIIDDKDIFFDHAKKVLRSKMG